MQLYKRNDSNKYWVSWNDQDGKRIRRSTGVANRKLAEALAAKWVKDGFLEEHFGKKPDVPFEKALLPYAKTHKRDHTRTFERVTRYRLKHFQERFRGMMLSEFTFQVVQDFMDERFETVSRATVQKDTAILKAILNKAHREGLIDSLPRFPKFKALKHRTRWLTLEEEEKLTQAASSHLVPLIRMAVDTGGRLSELLGLDWRNVELDNGRIRFTDTKNGEDRSIRLCKRARATLAALSPKQSGPVFTYKGKAVKSMKTAFNRARTRAGLEDLRFHDLRHTFASRLVQAGVPLYEVMHLTGHKSFEMVQRYSHLAPDYAEKAIQALDAFGHVLVTVENENAA
jgi:integrase